MVTITQSWAETGLTMRTSILSRSQTIARELAPKWSGAWGRKKDGVSCRLCFDAAHLWKQILVSWSDWSDRWLLTSERWIMPTCSELLLFEANAFKRTQKKSWFDRSNYLIDHCKWADGWHQIKDYRLPCHFFSPRPCWACFAYRAGETTVQGIDADHPPPPRLIEPHLLFLKISSVILWSVLTLVWIRFLLTYI